jgi:hypothetical protein
MLRTYVIDNGASYSDHTIYFIEADPSVMDPLLAAYQKAWTQTGYAVSFVLFVADKVDWRVDGRMTIADWLRYLNLSDGVADLAAAEEFRRLALAIYPDCDFARHDFWLRQ